MRRLSWKILLFTARVSGLIYTAWNRDASCLSAVLHALCDAILGALCAGEIGILFPPTDESIKGISSVKIAKKVLEIVRAHHAQIEHIDATIITQEPKIKPHYDTVRKSLAEVFEMPLENVSFKSKSHEHVGEIGRGEAAMCHAVATLKIQK